MNRRLRRSLRTLDYSVWDADKEAYFAAIRAGQGNDYRPMRELVRIALKP